MIEDLRGKKERWVYTRGIKNGKLLLHHVHNDEVVNLRMNLPSYDSTDRKWKFDKSYTHNKTKFWVVQREILTEEQTAGPQYEPVRIIIHKKDNQWITYYMNKCVTRKKGRGKYEIDAQEST